MIGDRYHDIEGAKANGLDSAGVLWGYGSQEELENAGADYIKTSTGFGTGGATFEDIELFKKHIGSGVKIKAAGGVSTLEDLQNSLKGYLDTRSTDSIEEYYRQETAFQELLQILESEQLRQPFLHGKRIDHFHV